MNTEASKERVMVDAWDSPTRILHWVNALLIVLLALEMLAKDGMGALGVERDPRRAMNVIHGYTGFAFIFFFSLRMIWAFVGNQYAKWGDLIPLSSERRRQVGADIKWYLSGLRGATARVVGHGALASILYLMLFLVLGLMIVTGFLLTGLIFDWAPASYLVGGMSEESEDALRGFLFDVHEFGNWFLIFFFFIHIASIVINEIKRKTGFLSSMVHGKKYMTKED